MPKEVPEFHEGKRKPSSSHLSEKNWKKARVSIPFDLAIFRRQQVFIKLSISVSALMSLVSCSEEYSSETYDLNNYMSTETRGLNVTIREFLDESLNLNLRKDEEVVYAQDNGVVVFIGRLCNHNKLQKVAGTREGNVLERSSAVEGEARDSSFDF